jgi:D-glycero-D-manno-heptose 1,7-bisphosphate phosphatase
MTFQAVFLVGGLGTRLGRLVDETPKPLLPVGGRPFLDHLIDRACRAGAAEIVLVAAHLGARVRDRYHAARPGGVPVRVLTEPAPAGTAGALRFAAPQLADTFMLANGDSLFDLPLAAFMAEPTPPPVLARLALRRVADIGRYGAVSLSDGGVITAFAEKGASGPGLANGGVYRIDKRLVARIPRDGACSLERDVFPDLVAERRIEGRVFDGFFIDIGIPEDLARADALLPGLPPPRG